MGSVRRVSGDVRGKAWRAAKCRCLHGSHWDTATYPLLRAKSVHRSHTPPRNGGRPSAGSGAGATGLSVADDIIGACHPARTGSELPLMSLMGTRLSAWWFALWVLWPLQVCLTEGQTAPPTSNPGSALDVPGPGKPLIAWWRFDAVDGEPWTDASGQGKNA